MIQRIRLSTVVLSFAFGSAAVLAAGDPALLTSPKNGQVLHAPGVQAIFWGAAWNDSTFAGDVVTGIDDLLNGYSNSTYANSPTEYSDRAGFVTPVATYWGHSIDTSSAPNVDGLTSSVAIAEACKMTGNQPDPGSVYVVFGSMPNTTVSCAYHTWGTCGTGRKAVPIQVAAIAYSSGLTDSTCPHGVQDTLTGHSLALAQIANLTMHEVIETITDPRGNGWRDANGDEIADKCQGTFPPSLSSYPMFTNGLIWKLQAMWSNAAYLSGSGTPNSVGQPGCIW
jgi:hypothetical protein